MWDSSELGIQKCIPYPIESTMLQDVLFMITHAQVSIIFHCSKVGMCLQQYCAIQPALACALLHCKTFPAACICARNSRPLLGKPNLACLFSGGPPNVSLDLSFLWHAANCTSLQLRCWQTQGSCLRLLWQRKGSRSRPPPPGALYGRILPSCR